MNRNSFSNIQALNVIVFIFFAVASMAAGIGFGALLGNYVFGPHTTNVVPMLVGFGLGIYAVRQAWFTAFGDKKFGKKTQTS